MKTIKLISKNKVMLLIITLLIINSVSATAYADGGANSKLPADLLFHPLRNHVQVLMEQGIIKDTDNVLFHPNRAISQQELVLILANILNQHQEQMSGKWNQTMGYNSEHIQSLSQAEAVSWSANISNNEQGNFYSNTELSYLEKVFNQSTNNNYKAETIRVFANGLMSIKAEDFQAQKPASAEMVVDSLFNVILWQVENDVKLANPQLNGNRSYIQKIATASVAEKAEFLKNSGIIKEKVYSNKGFNKAEVAEMVTKYMAYEVQAVDIVYPDKNVIEGPYISQVSPVYAPVGCEATSLLMALKAKGYAKDVGLRQFLDAMPKTTSNPAKGFVGSPYVPDLSKRTRTTIFPPILTKFGLGYGNVVDISGYNPYQLKQLVLQGVPVVAYVTMDYKEPFYRWYTIEGGVKKRWLSNNHVVLIAGYDSISNRYYIRDPYNVKNTSKKLEYWIDAVKFDRLYNERQHAVAVY